MSKLLLGNDENYLKMIAYDNNFCDYMTSDFLDHIMEQLNYGEENFH